MEQPWVGVNLDAAADAASQVGDSLDLPNTTFENLAGQPLNQSFAPIFASGTIIQGFIPEGIVNGAVFDPITNSTVLSTSLGFIATPDNEYTFAIVGSQDVPEPLTILGTLTAFGFGTLAKNKKRNRTLS